MAKERGASESRRYWQKAQEIRRGAGGILTEKIRRDLNPLTPQPGLKNRVLTIYAEMGLEAAQKFFKENRGPYTEAMFWQWIGEYQNKNGRSYTSKNDRDDGR